MTNADADGHLCIVGANGSEGACYTGPPRPAPKTEATPAQNQHGFWWKVGHALGVVETEEEKKADAAAYAAYLQKKTAWEEKHPGRSYAMFQLEINLDLASFGLGGGFSIVGEGAEGALELTSHMATRLAQRGFTEAALKEAIETAKASGQVVTKMGPYGTPQNIYSGANGITVVVETQGRNAGKLVTAWVTGSKP